MTAHISKPFVSVEDSNGNPYVAAKLYVYDVNSTTLKTIYSDAGLSISVTNPLISNANGDFDRAYLASGTYKLRAETAAGVLIWQDDYIDTGLTSGSGALAIASGGTAATTAAAARTSLGAAAQTDVNDLSSQITTINTTLQTLVAVPQGRLTLTTATPVLAADVLSATSVYYTPYVGNIVPIYDGVQFNLTPFPELPLTLNSNHVAGGIYDGFTIKDSGSVLLVTGPAWNTATAGAGARGTGAGTTELVRVNGLWTNKFAMTARNGATTYAVNANAGTYVGSIFIDGSAGQVTCHNTFGQSRKCGVWNAYNRKPIILKAGDSTANWNYATATIRQANATAGNVLTIFSGLPEEWFDLKETQNAVLAVSSSAVIGIGYNSTTTISGKKGIAGATAGSGIQNIDMVAAYLAPPTIGINNITANEQGGGGGTTTFVGTEPFMLLSAKWDG